MKKRQCFATLMLVMRKFMPTSLALFFAGSLYAHNSSAQEILDRSVSITASNIEIAKVISKVQKQSGVKFIFSSNAISADRLISCDVKNKKLKYFFEQVFLPLGIGYNVVDDQVILYSVKKNNSASEEENTTTEAPVFRTVTGVVSDDKGEPLVGASVILKNTSRYSMTNERGAFSIEVDNDNAILVVSYTGYETKEINVGSENRVNISLVASNKSLNEIIVVGYGTQRRRSVTGAISRVSSEEITAMPVSDPRQALQGRVAGVSIVNNGAPGDAPIIRIRGIGSINYSSDPFYVVDGFPGGDMSMIDGRDIQSVEVLRDASAAAIYGSRAANGVIIVTTKKGAKTDKPKINLDTYFGFQKAWKTLDLLNTEEYIRYATALKANAGTALPARFNNLDQPVYAGATQTYRQTNTDWQDEMFRVAPITQTNISLTSGNGRSRYYASAGYTKQQGIMLGTEYQRYNIRFNSDHNLGKIFSFGHSFTVAADEKLNENNSGGRTQLQHMIRSLPYMPVEDPTLPGGYRGPSGDDGSDPQNPVRVALQDISRNNTIKILGAGYVDVKIIPALSYRFTAGVNYVHFNNRLNNPIYNESFNARVLNRVEQSQTMYRSLYFSNQLNFAKRIGSHDIGATVVAESQNGRSRNLFGGGTYTTNELREVTNSLQNVGVSGGLSEDILYSYLGRVNYSYDDRYLLSASYRRDGSSVFAPGKKWANFPSVSVGWRISSEEFFKSITLVNELKLRASWGKMGFNGIGNYAWQPLLLQNTAPVFGGGQQSGAFFNALGNSDLEWEITDMKNIGVDVGLWDNKIYIQAEYYIRKTDGLILQTPLAPSLGFSVNTPANVGSMENKGFELQATYTQRSGEFKWDVSANFSTVKNKVLSFGEKIKAPIFAGGNADFGGFDITRTIVGDPVQSFYGWKVAGIFQTQAEIDASAQKTAKPGDIRFEDISGPDGKPDGAITADDRVVLGNFIPDFTYGINFSANYKGFDAVVFLQGVQGNTVYNGTKVLTQGMLRLFNAGKEVLSAWTPQNPNTNIPRAVDGDPNNNSRTSNRFLENGSYLRVKVFSIGYNVPKSALSSLAKGAISNARIYLASQNLLTFTRYSGYDPEIGSRFNAALTSGIDYGQFPQARTILLGLQLSF